MGLDTVELILAVEEEFKIKVPNEVAAQLFTVGDLHEFVVAEIVRCRQVQVDRDAIYDVLRDLICSQLGVTSDAVVPIAHFVRDLRVD